MEDKRPIEAYKFCVLCLRRIDKRWRKWLSKSVSIALSRCNRRRCTIKSGQLFLINCQVALIAPAIVSFECVCGPTFWLSDRRASKAYAPNDTSTVPPSTPFILISPQFHCQRRKLLFKLTQGSSAKHVCKNSLNSNIYHFAFGVWRNATLIRRRPQNANIKLQTANNLSHQLVQTLLMCTQFNKIRKWKKQREEIERSGMTTKQATRESPIRKKKMKKTISMSTSIK